MEISEFAAGHREVVHRPEGVGMVVAQHPPPGGQGLLVQGAGALKVSDGRKRLREFVHRLEGVGMVGAEHPPTAGQGLLKQRQGLPVPTSASQVCGSLVQEPQLHHRLYVYASAMVGDGEHVGQQPFTFSPGTDLVAGIREPGLKQQDGGGSPIARCLGIQPYANHGL